MAKSPDDPRKREDAEIERELNRVPKADREPFFFREDGVDEFLRGGGDRPRSRGGDRPDPIIDGESGISAIDEGAEQNQADMMRQMLENIERLVAEVERMGDSFDTLMREINR